MRQHGLGYREYSPARHRGGPPRQGSWHPDAGARLTQYYTRSRWTQGQVYTWLRARKQTGHGEALSGLGFDRLVDAKGREV